MIRRLHTASSCTQRTNTKRATEDPSGGWTSQFWTSDVPPQGIQEDTLSEQVNLVKRLVSDADFLQFFLQPAVPLRGPAPLELSAVLTAKELAKRQYLTQVAAAI